MMDGLIATYCFRRAGQDPNSEAMAALIKVSLQAPHTTVYGTYTHANFSYSAKDGQTAAQYLAQEVAAANDCAKRVLQIAKDLNIDVSSSVHQGALKLAVGATPTAHAAGVEWEDARAKAGVAQGQLVGKVELWVLFCVTVAL